MATVFGGPEKDVSIKTSVLEVCPGPGQYQVPSVMDRAGGSTKAFSPQRKKNGFGNSTRDDFKSYFRHQQPLDSPAASSYASMPSVEGSFENLGNTLSRTFPGARRLDTAGRPIPTNKKERALYSPPPGTLLTSQSRAPKDRDVSTSPMIPRTCGTGKYHTGTELGRSSKLSRIRNGASMSFGSFERDMFRDHLQGRWREALQTPGPTEYYPTANISFSTGSPRRKKKSAKNGSPKKDKPEPRDMRGDKLYSQSKKLRPGAFGDSKRLPFGDTVVLPRSSDFIIAESKELPKKERRRMRAESLQKAVDLENDKKPDGRPKTPFDAYRKPWNPKNTMAKSLFGTANRPFHAHIEPTPAPGAYDTESGTRLAVSRTANAKCGYRPTVPAAGGSVGQPFAVTVKEKENATDDGSNQKYDWDIKIDHSNEKMIKDYQKQINKLVKEMKSGSLSLDPKDRALTPKTNQRRIYTSIDTFKPPPSLPKSPASSVLKDKETINILKIHTPSKCSTPSVVTFADPIEDSQA